MSIVHSKGIHSTLITYDEFQASEITGFSVKTLRQRRWSKKGPRFLKIGRKVRYRESDLLEFLEQSTVKPLHEILEEEV